MGAFSRAINGIRRRLIIGNNDVLIMALITVIIGHCLTGNLALGFIALSAVLTMVIALRGPDDRFTRACQLIDIAMDMATEEERRLLVAFELADDETRRKALEAIQRVANPTHLFNGKSSGD